MHAPNNRALSSINSYMPLGGGPGCYFTCKVISPLACGRTICCAPATVLSVHYDKRPDFSEF